MEEYYDKPGIILNEFVEDDVSDFSSNQLNELDFLQKSLQDFKLKELTKDSNIDFIGAHPVSLLRSHYAEVLQNQYDWLICEKTDGVRYLMIILNNGHVYLTGRFVGGFSSQKDYQFFRVNVQLPQCKKNLDQLQILEFFDGELVIDVKQNKSYLNYLIFDTLIHNAEQKITKKNQSSDETPFFTYFERLRCAEEFIQLKKKLKNFYGVQESDLQQLECFPKIKLILKDFFYVHQIKYLFEDYIPIMPHKNDGIIFTQNKAQYQSGTCQFIRKWKPSELQSIDFLICNNNTIEIKNPEYCLLELYVQHKIQQQSYLLFFDFIYSPVGFREEIKEKINELYQRLEEAGQVQPVKGVIAECVLDRRCETNEKLQQLYNPQVWGRDNSEVDYFLRDLLKNTTHFTAEQYKNNEVMMEHLELLKEIREQIHLKYNFKSEWKIIKYRSDKTNPNSKKVGLNILQIISENLSQKELIQAVGKG